MSGNPLNSPQEMDKIYGLLKEGDERIELSPGKDVILLLGNTGSGKTTLSQFITGNSDHLISQEVEEGTGEFIIVDKNNKISNNSTVVSKTIFPDLVEDVKTNTTYYDCPGFSDTRSAAHEIAASYFIKKVIDSSRSVKFVFVVNHHSVRTGVDRRDFMLLLRHAVEFIKDIEKYKDSIALVVTKVQNSYITVGETESLVSDSSIIKAVANYLQQVKLDILDRPQLMTKTGQTLVYRDRALHFLNSLLIQENEDYVRIGIFRRPDKPGLLKNNKLLQNEEFSIMKMISENIRYTKKDETNFGYTISSDAKIYINDLVEEIYANIVNILTSLAAEIEQQYTLEEQEISEIEKLEEMFQMLNEMLSEMQTVAINDLISSQEYLYRIKNMLIGMNVDTYDGYLSEIVKEEGYINFLNFVNSELPQKYLSSMLAEGLTNLVDYFEESQKWYNCLINLHVKLSEYNIQKDKDRYIIKEINKFNDLIDTPLRPIIENTFKGYDNVWSISLNKPKLNFLNKILKQTLASRVYKACHTPDKLIIKGPYIKLSDVSKEKCNGRNMKSIELLAMNKVYFDTDLDLTGDEVQLAIIAPTWEVLGKSRIILDGKSGEEYAHSKAASGNDFGSNGSDGLPGRPGGPAGSFFGIGKDFINDDLLQISANGGNGGKGQDGGDGRDGANDSGVPEIKKQDIFIVFNSVIQWIPGQEGGNGGNGGVGGNGGYQGNITIIGVGTNARKPETKTIALPGSPGKGGLGGKGGRGGRYSERSSSNIFFIVNMDNTKPLVKWANNGNSGEAAINSIGIQGAWKTKEYRYSYNAINTFMNYMQENLKGNIKESDVRVFLNEIDNNERIAGFYSTLALVEEMKSLEHKFHTEYDKTSLLPLYKSLLQRITLYAKTPRACERSAQYIKALYYLSAAVLSKVSYISNDSHSDLIIDIKGYLELIISNINKLKDMAHDHRINEFYSGLKETVNIRIKEANDFVNIHVIQEIEIIFRNLDDSIQSLLDEVAVALQNEKQKINEKQQKLESTLILKQILSPIKLVCSLLKFIPKLNVGKIVETGIDFVESFNPDENENNRLPEEMSEITNLINARPQLFLEQLNDADRELVHFETKAECTDLKDLHKEISNSKQKLEEQLSAELFNPEVVETVRNMRKNIKEKLRGEYQKWSSQIGRNGTNVEQNLKTINHVKNTISITTDLYQDVKNHQRKINEIVTATEKLHKKITLIEEYEENLCKIIVPMVTKLKADISKKEEMKSHLAVEISRFKIQNTIKDVKQVMYKFSKGFPLEERVIRCINNLQEGMTTMSNIFRLIEGYRDEMRLYSYLTRINSSKQTKILITDEELKKAIDELDFVIESNIILGQYDRAIGAFKQHIFPFARVYLPEFNLPPTLKFQHNLDDLVNYAVSKITDLKAKLSESTLTIGKYDKHVHTSNLYQGETEEALFYLWSYDSNKEAISNLLEGKEVLLEANVANSPKVNAVKFSVIDLKFEPRQKALRDELLKDLEHFQVAMTHFGNSYYRCGDKVYVIFSNKETISFHLRKNFAGEPISTNLVYDKIKANDFKLSPYAMWSIQLTGMGSNINLLQKYKNQTIDLELRGRGQYVDNGINENICNQDLQHYYELDYIEPNDAPQIDERSLSPPIEKNEYINGAILFPDSNESISFRERRFVREGSPRKTSDGGTFITSGCSTPNKNSLLNNILNAVIGGFLTARSWNFFIGWRDNSNIVDTIWNPNRSSLMPLITVSHENDVEVAALEYASTNNGGSFLNHNNLHSANSQSILLWDLVLKKLTGSSSSPINRKLKSYEGEDDFANNLAYRYYAPHPLE